jgi:hypothetical protein
MIKEFIMSSTTAYLAHLLIRFCLVLGLILTLNLIISTPTARACTEPVGGHPVYTVAERTQAAEVVLEGLVLDITNPDNEYAPRTATVKVYRYFKGTGPAIVTISGFGPPMLCLDQVYLGTWALFYTTGEPETGLYAHYMGNADAVDPVTPATVAEIIAAAGHEPVVAAGHWFYLPLILKLHKTTD